MKFRYVFASLLLSLSILLLSDARAIRATSASIARQSRIEPLAVAQTNTNDLRQPLSRIGEIVATTPTYTDDFSSNTDRWSTSYDGETSRYYRAWTYRIAVDGEGVTAWGESDLAVDQFLLEVDTQRIAGSLNNEFGILFGYLDGENFVHYAISSDGYYKLYISTDGEWESVVSWTETDLIDLSEDAVNRMGILVEADQLSLLVNGDLLTTVEMDESYTSGGIALAVGTIDEAGVEIAFDNFSLWDLEAEEQKEPPSGGLSGFRQASTPVATAVPTLQSTPAAAPTALSPAAAARVASIEESEPTYRESFDEDLGEWTGIDTDEATTFHEDQSLRVHIDAPAWIAWSQAPFDLDDFLLEVDVVGIAGPEDREYGVIFNLQDIDNYDVFGISGRGTFSVRGKVDGEWQTFLDWTAADAIDLEEEAVNRVGVLSENSILAFFVNGIQVAELAEGDVASGEIGLMAGSFDEGGVEAAFVNVELWDLGEISAPPPRSLFKRLLATPAPSAAVAQMENMKQTLPAFLVDFSSTTDAWSGTTDSDVVYGFDNQALSLEVLTPDLMAWSSAPFELGDYYAEVDATIVDAPGDMEYGFMFNFADAANFQLFALGKGGTYSLWEKTDNEWQAIIDWTPSPFIKSEVGDTNKLGMLLSNGQLGLWVNGELLAEAPSGAGAGNGFGLAVASFGAGGVEANFENLSIWTPEP